MKKILIVLSVTLLVVVGLVGSASAALAADPPGQGSDFVCPVIHNEAVGSNNPQAGPLGVEGYYTVVPDTANNGHLNVPDQATNGNGTGSPGGPFSAPGDTDYTAIWNGD